MPTVPIEILKKRRDFLTLARATSVRMPGMIVQGRDRADGRRPIRIGYTCSRKVGNAVTRNRAKRRLRAAARAVLAREGQVGWDYVLIGRRDATIARPFTRLLEDLSAALMRLHPTR